MSTTAEPEVVIVQASIRQYRAAFFRTLRERLSAAGVALRLIHSDDPAYLHPKPHKAKLAWAEVRPGRRFGIRGRSLLWQPVVRATRRADLVVVEQASHLLANYALLARQRLGGPRLAFWGHGRNYLLREGERSVSETVKRIASRQVHWWFAYSDETADVVAQVGFPRERITVVHNATDTHGLAHEIAAVSPQQLSAVREELGLTGDRVGLFLGTLGAVKRFDHLFAAADAVRERVPDFELVIAGSGQEEPRITDWTRRRPWAHCAGPRFGADAAPLLSLSTLLLVPGWAGLVVVDSFAAGVPLVASASGPHPPEIAYLRDGHNGRLVDDGGDPNRYADAVVELLCDDAGRAKLVAGCIEARSRYSAEAMAENFTKGVLAALA